LLAATDAIALAVLSAGGGVASAVDVNERRIPNRLCVAIAATGLVLAAGRLSGISIWSSVAGFAIGFMMMLPGHILGATGAGDVKLFAASGTILGASRTVEAFFYVALVGGVFALSVAWHRGRLLKTVANTGRLCGNPTEAKAAIESPTQHNRFPYGPAIAVGSVLAVVL
jgi:prepilin peptidase CpaA